jgi:hypothetical protein
MKKRRGDEGRREGQADPRQRSLFEGWGVAPAAAESQGHARDEFDDRET